MKTETQLLVEIFPQYRLEHYVGSWYCSGRDHDHDAKCKPDYYTLATGLPKTEIDLARSLARFIGTSTLVYVPGLEEWQVMDDGIYRALAGDYFVHNCIKRYAQAFTDSYSYAETLLKEQVSKEIEGPSKKLASAEVDNNEALKTQIKDAIRDTKGDLKTDHDFFFREAKSLATKLGTERGLISITNVLRSELCERPQSVDDLGFTSIDDFMDETIEPGLVEGLITARGLGQIFGEAYKGKTYTAVDLICSVAAGLPTWMGRRINVDGPQEVLYIAAEGGDPIRKMFQGWQAAHPEADLSGVTIRDGAKGASLTLSDKPLPPGIYGLEDLKAEYRSRGKHPRLILIDPQANVTPGVDENSTALAHALQPLQEWANEEDMFIMLVHHTGKNTENGARGTSAQGALMDVQIQFKAGTGSERSMHFQKVKGEVAPDQAVKIEFVDIDTPKGPRAYIRHVGGLPSVLEKINGEKLMQRSKIIAAIEAGCGSVSTIAAHSGINRNAVSAERDSLEAEGRIINEGTISSPKWVMNTGVVPTKSISAPAPA